MTAASASFRLRMAARWSLRGWPVSPLRLDQARLSWFFLCCVDREQSRGGRSRRRHDNIKTSSIFWSRWFRCHRQGFWTHLWSETVVVTASLPTPPFLVVCTWWCLYQVTDGCCRDLNRHAALIIPSPDRDAGAVRCGPRVQAWQRLSICPATIPSTRCFTPRRRTCTAPIYGVGKRVFTRALVPRPSCPWPC